MCADDRGVNWNAASVFLAASSRNNTLMDTSSTWLAVRLAPAARSVCLNTLFVNETK